MPKGRLRTEPGDVQLIVHDPIPAPALDRPTVRDARALAARAHAVGGRDRRAAAGSDRADIILSVHVTAIVAAGGRGERFGASQPKQLFVIGGRSMLERSVQLLVSHPAVAEVVVALPPSLAADPPAWLRVAPKRLRVVAGGPRRQDSVANAFAAISDETDVVVIHDAARPFASPDLVSRTIDAAAETGAALAALPARDTVKRSGPAEAASGQRSG